MCYLETANSDGQICALNSSIGYNFNKHFGMDLAVPVYFVNASSTSGGGSSDGIGNPSLDLRWKFLNGFSTCLNSYIDTEIGYTRSVHYDLNSVSFSLGFNGRLLPGSVRQ